MFRYEAVRRLGGMSRHEAMGGGMSRHEALGGMSRHEAVGRLGGDVKANLYSHGY